MPSIAFSSTASARPTSAVARGRARWPRRCCASCALETQSRRCSPAGERLLERSPRPAKLAVDRLRARPDELEHELDDGLWRIAARTIHVNEPLAERRGDVTERVDLGADVVGHRGADRTRVDGVRRYAGALELGGEVTCH